MEIQPILKLKGSFDIPSDKSISHRSVMFGSLALGTTHITNFLMGADCLSTIRCFRQMGVTIDVDEISHTVTVHGKGLKGLTAPLNVLDCGNSGTTVRLISGILAGQNFSSTLTGDASIQKRPMKRVITPLSQMGAQFTAKEDNFCPMTITPHSLSGITYTSPVASAQVKSSILLAGLYADGPTSVIEPAISRDHTERMLTAFGAKVEREGTKVTIHPCQELYATDIEVPGDISSAAFFMVAGLITPNSEITIKNVGINPTRRGILDVLLAMGGDITCTNERLVGGEPVCDLVVRSSKLHATTVAGDIIPTLIDEIPVIAVAALFAEGTTVIKDAAELRVKESDRIDAIYTELTKLGAHMTTQPDGMCITGGYPLQGGATLETYDDHRIAMSLTIAASQLDVPCTLNHAECVNISFPNFYELLASHSC